MKGKRKVLVTGASGYIGSLVTQRLADLHKKGVVVMAVDVREPIQRIAHVQYASADVRDGGITKIFSSFKPDSVVHLASIVSPGKKSNPELEYSVDVGGTKNVVEACIQSGAKHLTVTSSGAAYGYHADNRPRLLEGDPIRGNREFPYSWHKRLVEEMLAKYRMSHPHLRQLVFRPGTVIGASTSNQITALFEKKFVVGIRGTGSPFVFIYDGDVVEAIVRGVIHRRTGIFNLAGDGTVTLPEVARILGKRFVPVPAALTRAALFVLKPLGVSRYGPEQVDFLRYRPVLSNERLKKEFGYTPRYSSLQAFMYYLEHNPQVRGGHR